MPTKLRLPPLFGQSSTPDGWRYQVRCQSVILDCMTSLAKQVGSPCRRVFACATAFTLLATVGCWEEIRYNPSQKPVKSPSEPVVLRSESPREVLAAPAPSADELFAGEHDGETASAGNVVAPTPEVEESSDDTDPPGSALDVGTALDAWQLASKWSLAVGIYGKGFAADRYGELWEQADDAAQFMEVELPPLPQDVAADDLLATALTMLLENAGPELAAAVGARHSAQHRALCDLAIKTHALLLIYTPDGAEVKSLIAAIRRSAEDSALPEELWTPLIELLDARAEFTDVKRAIFQLHEQAAEHLGDAVAR